MNASQAYAPRSIKRPRRTSAEMHGIEDVIERTLMADHPMTVRQLFYALTVQHVIPKTEAAYKGIVIRLLTQMRRSGRIPYGWISDNTRWMRKPETHRGIGHALAQTARFYRRDLWADAPVYVEIWCEKDALAGVILEETRGWDVPLMVSRGFSSDTYLQASATAIIDAGKSVADLWRGARGNIADAENTGKVDADVALRLKALVGAQLAALDRNADEARAG